MNQSRPASVLVLALGGILLLILVAEVLGKAPNINQEAKPLEARQNAERKLIQLLSKPLNQDEFSGPLKEILSYLGDRYEVPIKINSEAFEQDLKMKEPEIHVVAVPKMSEVRFGSLLRLVLDQIGGTYLVRPNHFEITTCARVLEEMNWATTKPKSDRREDVQAAAAANQRALRKIGLVHVQVENKPLHEAVKDLQDSGVLNILVDPRTKEQALKPISVLLANVPTETALRLLADMAGLRLAVLDNVYYISTPENAEKIEKAQEGSNLKRARMEPATP